MTINMVSNFKFDDKVRVDDDEHFVATVTGFLTRHNEESVEISWFHNGEIRHMWMNKDRLSVIDKDRF